MGINWQDIFYLTTSLAMIVVFIAGVCLVWLIFATLKLIKNLTSTVHKWSNVVDDVRYFRKGIKLKILRFLSAILEKGGENERK